MEGWNHGRGHLTVFSSVPWRKQVQDFCGDDRDFRNPIHPARETASSSSAQSTERSPEKAGVGGSIPSLATIFNNLQATFLLFGCNWLHFASIAIPFLTARASNFGRTKSAFGLPESATPARAVGRHPAWCSPGCAAAVLARLLRPHR